MGFDIDLGTVRLITGSLQLSAKIKGVHGTTKQNTCLSPTSQFDPELSAVTTKGNSGHGKAKLAGAY